MKSFLSVLAVCGVLASTGAFAHGDHGKISGQGAMAIAAKSVQKMTFKDLGYGVGKLDDSWKGVKAEDVTLISETESYYVVSVANSAAEKPLFFKVATNGQVMEVKNRNDF